MSTGRQIEIVPETCDKVSGGCAWNSKTRKTAGTSLIRIYPDCIVRCACHAYATVRTDPGILHRIPSKEIEIAADRNGTSRAIVIDEGYERYGVTAEIASVIADGAFYYLDAPVKRIGAMDVPVPFSPVLEDQTVPTPEAVAAIAKTLCNKI